MASNELSRSTLLRKDRDELVAIAGAMGGKPGSRTRKAQIVDMILELAGVNADGTSDGAATPSDAGGAESADADADADAEAPAPDSTADADRSSGSGSDTARGSSRSNDDDQGGGGDGGESAAKADGPDSAGDDDGDADDAANRRRRRRRGRDRDNGEGEAEAIEISGHLDLRDDGYGFVRVDGARPSRRDVYVSVKQVRQNGLRKGDHVVGSARPANRNEKNPALVEVGAINGGNAAAARERRRFDELPAVDPHVRFALERADDPTSRLLDLLTPMGMGQRALVVAPPRSGATPVLKSITRSIESNHPDCTLFVVLLDERPEEVTEMKEWVTGGEVIASPFDRPPDEHVLVADMALERAKRLVEAGEDVVIIADGMSRLARAHNVASAGGGRTLSGGIEPAAIYQPKRFFGAARCLADGGSLTVVATVNAASGSRLDDLLLGELVEGANLEIHLDRALADAGIVPPIDVESTRTRRPDGLVDADEQTRLVALRAALSATDSLSEVEALLERLERDGSNDKVLAAAGR